jgi:hypothetical protein
MRRRLWALALVAVVALSGCAEIPTSGPIHTGDVALNDPGQPIPLAMEPQQDASPEAIVYGFLAASQAGLNDQFVGARKFLTYSAAASWVPTTRLLVYPSTTQPDVEAQPDGTVVVRVPVQGSLDDTGVYTEASAGSREELAMELTQNTDGQWRISSLDDVVVMSSSDFSAYYRQVALYFATIDRHYLVPDVRWFPANGAPSYAARALLAGPAPWLRDAVVSGAPEGTRLGASGVDISADQTATVDLTAAAASADAADRSLLIAQLTETLERAGTTVSSVVVTAGEGKPWQSTVEAPERDPQPDTGPYVIADGRLQVLADGQLTPVEGSSELTDGTHDPAISMDGSIRVALVGSGTLVRLPNDGSAPVELYRGTALLPPSIDRYGWIWTAEANGPGLIAVSPEGEVMEVTGDVLAGTPAGSPVLSLSVARDGSRIALVHEGGDQRPAIDVATILRDTTGTGRPQRLGSSFQVGFSMTDASQVEWMDESTLAVLGLSGSLVAPTVHLVPVGGQTSALPLVDGTVSIAAGRGDRALYLVDADGTLLWRQGAAWTDVAVDVRDPVFPG